MARFNITRGSHLPHIKRAHALHCCRMQHALRCSTVSHPAVQDLHVLTILPVLLQYMCLHILTDCSSLVPVCTDTACCTSAVRLLPCPPGGLHGHAAHATAPGRRGARCGQEGRGAEPPVGGSSYGQQLCGRKQKPRGGLARPPVQGGTCKP